MTVRVTHEHEQYNFPTGVKWSINGTTGQLDVIGNDALTIATFIKWDNVQRINAGPSFEKVNNTQVRDFDIEDLFDKVESLSKLGKGFFGSGRS